LADNETFYATGKRKNAIARVWLQPGQGTITVNGVPLETFVQNRRALEIMVRTPLVVAEAEDKYDIRATTKGGGISGQAGALRHGIAKALSLADPRNRPLFQQHGLLTRDPRVKERKKYGRKRARGGFQFSKR